MKNKVIDILSRHNINGKECLGGTDKATIHSYDDFYSTYLDRFVDQQGSLLELGVWQGGSALLWHDLLPMFKLHLVDIRDEIHPSIWERMNKSRYNFTITDAYTTDCINLYKSLNPGGYDIIVEDGPHTLYTQMFTIKEYTKLLKKGGVLIMEDIQDFNHIEIFRSLLNEVEHESFSVYDMRDTIPRYDDVIITIVK